MSKMANTGYIPMLIVGQDKNGEYIHIKDADKSEDYFCPCCHQLIKIRARESKKVQPHFYHTTDSPCVKSESIIHWTYKNWLFVKGSKFKLSDEDELHIVEKIDIENIYHTNFGDYQPDITVYDSDGIRYFFEINYSNKKKYSNYADKWCELNSKVVEINVKDLIDSSFNGTVPEFDILFKDGKYFGRLKKQNDSDAYVRLQERKKEIIESKQRDLEYVNKLDLVWKYTQEYVRHEIDEEDFFILSCFKDLDLNDQHFFALMIKKLKCIDLEDVISDYVLDDYIKEIKSEVSAILNLEQDFEVNIKEDNSSKFIVHLSLYIKNKNKDITLYFPDYKKIKKYANRLPVSIEKEFVSFIDKKLLKKYSTSIKKIFTAIDYLTTFDYKNINILFKFPKIVKIKNSRFNFKLGILIFDKLNNKYLNPLLIETRIIFNDEITFTNNTEWTTEKLQYADERYGVLKSINVLQDIINNNEDIIFKINNIQHKLRELENRYTLPKNCIHLNINEFTSYSVNISFSYKKFVISKIRFEDIQVNIDMFKSALDITYRNFKERFTYLMDNDIFGQFNIIESKINKSKNNLWSAKLLTSQTEVRMMIEFNKQIFENCISDIKEEEDFMISMDFKWIMRNLTHDRLCIDIPLISSDLFNFDKETIIENTFCYQGDSNNLHPIVSWTQYVANELSQHIANINKSRIPIWFVEKVQKGENIND